MTKHRSEEPGRYVTVEEPGRIPYRAWQPAPLSARPDLDRITDLGALYERHDRTLTPARRWDSPLAARAECFASCAIEDIVPDPAQLAHMWPITLRARPLPSPRATAADRRQMWQSRRVVGLWQAMTADGAADADTNRRDHRLIEPDWNRTVGYDTAGEYRTHRVWIGGSTPATAAFVPPPWETVPELMDDLYRWVAARLDERRLPVTLIAAVAHAQFETVHPYSDGNGRAGRLLIRRIHQTAGTGPIPISAAMWRDRRDYYRALDMWRHPDGGARWLDWYSQRLAAAARTVDDLTDRATAITDRLNEWISAAGMRPGPTDTAFRLVAQLPDQPVFTVASVADPTGKSPWSIRATTNNKLVGVAVEPLPPPGRRPAAWWNREMWYLTVSEALRTGAH